MTYSGGFNTNGAENGVRLLDHVYGGHGEYYDTVMQALDAYNSLNPNLSADQAAQLLKTFAGSLRQHLLNTQLPLY